VGSTVNLLLIVHFLCLPKENEPKEKAPVPFGPLDSVVLLKAAGILKTRGVYAPKGCSDSLKSFIGIFCGAHQMPMGK